MEREGGDLAVMTPQEKAALQFQVTELVEADEPGAMLATMKRIAERMAFRAAQSEKREVAARWQELVDTLDGRI